MQIEPEYEKPKGHDAVQKKLHELERLMDFVKEAIEDDRDIAVKWFTELKERYDEDELTTEDGSIEREINAAMRNVINTTDKIPKILDAISKITSALVKERALLTITGNQEKVLSIDTPEDRLKLLEAKSMQMLDAKVERTIYEEK